MPVFSKCVHAEREDSGTGIKGGNNKVFQTGVLAKVKEHLNKIYSTTPRFQEANSKTNLLLIEPRWSRNVGNCGR